MSKSDQSAFEALGYCQVYEWRGPHLKSRTGNRNRAIFAAMQAGQSVVEIGAQYRLSAERVRVILVDEQHKRMFSVDQHYRAVRRKTAVSYGLDPNALANINVETGAG